jgi:hypothetical protein
VQLDPVTRQPAGGSFGGRFYLVCYLPTYAAALFLLVLVWAGARGWTRPHQRISFKAAWATAAHLGTAEIVLLILTITLLAVVVQPLQLAMMRVAEGTWPPWLGTAGARRRQRRRKTRLLRAAQLPTGPELTDEAVQRAGAAGDLLRRRFPMPGHLLRPTALGNVLAAMEDTAGRAYGLDAVIAWPRLYPVLGDQVKSLVDDRRDSPDDRDHDRHHPAGPRPATTVRLVDAPGPTPIAERGRPSDGRRASSRRYARISARGRS